MDGGVNKPNDDTVLIPVKWKDAKDTQTRYANHLMVTHAGGEFYLVFGELFFPAMAQDEKPEYVEIVPVARIAISPDNMIRFSEAIRQNIEKFHNHQDGVKDDD